MPKNILWLASYPKSGNTWLRLFLYNYLFNPDKPAPINQAHRIGPGDATAHFYRKIAKGSIDLHDQTAVLRLRPNVIAALSKNGANVNFMKTHNINADAHGFRLIPPEVTRGALYIIRNPFDVAVSYAHHFACSYDEAALSLGQDTTVTVADETVVHQYLGNWSEHVRSWARARDFKTKVIRYEDMQSEPEKTFSEALRFIGAPPDEERVARAIRFSSFDEAKKQEKEHGFIEKPKKAEQFFRSGKVGEGRKALPQSAIDRILADHSETMKRYGYLE